MPCYTVQLTTVEFKAQNVELLEQSLNQLQLKYTKTNQTIKIIGSYLKIDLAQQQVVCERNEASLVNAIKRQYSYQAVATAAAKNKWIIKNMAPGKLALRRF